MQALEVHQHITESCDKVNHDTTRDVTSLMDIGKIIRQGDVYVKRVDTIPEDFTMATMETQIAKGNTKGSRHILEDDGVIRIFKKSSPAPLEGPAFKSTKEITLTHPEHANFKLPAGCYISYYQQDFAQEEIRAVRD